MPKNTKVEATAPVAAAPIAAAKPIFCLALVNPKVPGSKAHARFALYAENKTVEQYVSACTKGGFKRRDAVADLKWDVKHGFISFVDPGVEAAAK